MHLHDNLQVCLYALDSRYPIHTLDLNERFIKMGTAKKEEWTARGLIAFLNADAPGLLQKPAHLYIDETRCEIFMPEYSQEKPILCIHCRGKMPHRQVRIMQEATILSRTV